MNFGFLNVNGAPALGRRLWGIEPGAVDARGYSEREAEGNADEKVNIDL